MKKLLVLALITLFASCAPQGSHPDFDKNVETVKTLFALQGSEADLDAQLALVHEDIEWQPAFHGSAKIGKEAYKDYLKGWHDVMENVVYTPENYLPGVSVETSLALARDLIIPSFKRPLLILSALTPFDLMPSDP